MPEMEALEKLTIPAFEFPQLPDFDGKPPSLDGVTVPDVFINWNEPDYQPELLGDLQVQIRNMMAGGTGLPAAVEDALFSRARERDSAEAERAVQEAMDVWASRDFSMPPGMLAKQISVIREQSRLKAAELNRDILIEAAKWEIESIRFAVQQGMALEQLTMNLFENATKRLFEAARFQAEAKINVFNAQISLFNAQNAGFETLAQVYRTKLDGAIAKLTAYKTAIEGQVALGQINQQKVDVFKAKLAAVQSSVEVYKAMMSGAQVRADVIKNQFDAYRTEIQAFAEQIGAEKVKFDAYESQVKAESAKVGMYEAQARAYASTVQAVSNKADIKVKGAQLKMEAARTKVSKFLADVDAYKARLQASLSEIQTATSAYSAKVDGWKSLASANVAEAEMQSRFADMNTRTSIAYAEMQISEYQTKMQKAVEEAKIALEAAKAVGQYTAQLAAGAMSAAHVSASISGSGSSNVSRSRSNSESLSTSHNYNY
jgi:predicted  nucleic acid-binding Zn-ribbon protein